MQRLKNIITNLSAKQQKVLFISLIILFMAFLYCLLSLFTKGIYIDRYFHNDPLDAFMDYTNMLSLAASGDPYSKYSNYPPLVFVILKVFCGIIPSDFLTLTGYEFRNNAFVMISYVVFLIINISIIIFTVSSFLRDCGKIKYLFIFALLCSGPFIFTIERGNVILIAIAFSLLFYRFYDSESLTLRVLSYLALAIAISIKIYPAAFGLLVLSKKRYMEFALLVGISIVLFFVPFFFFGGINAIKGMVIGIISSSANQSSLGSNYNFSFINYFSIINEAFDSSIVINNLLFQILGSLTAISAFFFSRKEYIKTLSIVFAILYFPAFSYTYSLLFLLIPMLSFFDCDISLKEQKEKCWFFVLFYAITMCPIYLPTLPNTSMWYPLSYGYLILNIFVFVTLIVMLYIAISEFVILIKLKIKPNIFDVD